MRLWLLLLWWWLSLLLRLLKLARHSHQPSPIAPLRTCSLTHRASTHCFFVFTSYFISVTYIRKNWHHHVCFEELKFRFMSSHEISSHATFHHFTHIQWDDTSPKKMPHILPITSWRLLATRFVHHISNEMTSVAVKVCRDLILIQLENWAASAHLSLCVCVFVFVW